MTLYTDNPELEALHRHWLSAQTRMLEGHELARNFEARLAGEVPMAPEEIVAGADLAARARDATEIWLQIDERLTRAREERWASRAGGESRQAG